jgi:hypothetical protein
MLLRALRWATVFAAVVVATTRPGIAANDGGAPRRAGSDGSEALAGFVVLRRGAPIYRAPDENAVLVPARSDDAASGPYAFRFASVQRDWVEVISVGETHCAPGDFVNPQYALRVFVRRSDLQDVVRRRVAVRHPDGTGFTLSPGLPLYRIGDRFHVAVDGGSIGLPIPANAVGKSYASVPGPHPAGFAIGSVSPGTLRLGGQPVGHRYSSRPSMWAPGEFAVDEVERGSQRVTFHNACARIVLSTPSIGEVSSLGDSFGCREREREFQIEDGAPLFWRDGSSAGSVRRGLAVHEVFESGGLMCTRLRLASLRDEAVCFRPESVTKKASVANPP